MLTFTSFPGAHNTSAYREYTAMRLPLRSRTSKSKSIISGRWDLFPIRQVPGFEVCGWPLQSKLCHLESAVNVCTLACPKLRDSLARLDIYNFPHACCNISLTHPSSPSCVYGLQTLRAAQATHVKVRWCRLHRPRRQ